MLTRTALPLPRGTFKRIQIYLMFPTGAGLAPKEAIQARSKQDAHEALCATRKTSREDAERRRGASKIPAQDLSCLLLTSCSCSLGQRKSVSSPPDPSVHLFFPQKRLHVLPLPCPAVQGSTQGCSERQCSCQGSAPAPEP